MTQLGAQLLSMAIELPVAWLIVVVTRWPSRGALHVVLAGAVGTSVTHPLLWSGVEALGPSLGHEAAVLAGEAAVIAVEAAIYAWGAGLSARRALLLSALANVASAGIGFALLS
jgi:hypothetical protein